MAKTNVRTIAVALRQAGTYQLPNVQIGQVSSKFEIAISRDQLPDTLVDLASISIEGSADGGVTWDGLGSITLSGGVFHDRSGAVIAESNYAVEFRLNDEFGNDLGPDPQPATYRLRGTAILFQAITAGLRLTVY